MNYSELTQQWLDIADQDLKVAELTHANGYWLYAAFLCHQALEKALKAFWTATLDTNPPYTHSHAKLLEGSGLLDRLSEKQLQFIALMVPMYIEARYPSYKQRMASTLNETSSNYIINSTKEMIGWIKQQL